MKGHHHLMRWEKRIRHLAGEDGTSYSKWNYTFNIFKLYNNGIWQLPTKCILRIFTKIESKRPNWFEVMTCRSVAVFLNFCAMLFDLDSNYLFQKKLHHILMCHTFLIHNRNIKYKNNLKPTQNSCQLIHMYKHLVT